MIEQNLWSTGSTILKSVAIAVPPCKVAQQELFPLVHKHYLGSLKPRSLSVIEQVLAHKSIENRYIAIDSIEAITQLKDEDPDKRMDRFTHWAVSLSEVAVRKALDKAGITVDEVAGVIVNTCTGYICPGISTYLVEKLGLRNDVFVYDLVGAGCGAAIPNLQMGHAVLQSLNRGVVVCVAVEICTATYQMGDDMALLISNAIFGDGAAAVVLTKGDEGLNFRTTASRVIPKHREDVRYVYKNGQLHNHLAPALPKVTGETVSPFLTEFLEVNKIEKKSIDKWMIHPGGDKILNELQSVLKLSDGNMELSRTILRNYGNMSSPTVLFELESLMSAGLQKGETCCMVAFGAGMAMHAAILEVV